MSEQRPVTQFAAVFSVSKSPLPFPESLLRQGETILPKVRKREREKERKRERERKIKR